MPYMDAIVRGLPKELYLASWMRMQTDRLVIGWHGMGYFSLEVEA